MINLTSTQQIGNSKSTWLTFGRLIEEVKFENEQEHQLARLVFAEYLRINGWSTETAVPSDFELKFKKSVYTFRYKAGSRLFLHKTGSECIYLLRRLQHGHLSLLGILNNFPTNFAQALSWVVTRYAVRNEDIPQTMLSWLYHGKQPSREKMPILVAFEKSLGLDGMLSGLLPTYYMITPQPESKEPAPTFGGRLRQLREEAKFSRAKLLRRADEVVSACKIGKLTRWENYPIAPVSERDRELVAKFDRLLNAEGGLIQRFETALVASHYSDSEEIATKQYSYWSESVEAEFGALREFKTALILPKRIRRGRFAAWRSGESAEVARRAFSAFLGFCRLPENAADPKMRGKGMPDDQLTLFLIADSTLFLEYLDFRRVRSQGGIFYRGLVSLVAMMRALVRKDDGYLWQYAERYVGLQHLLVRANPAPGVSPVEALRQMCEEAEMRYNNFIHILDGEAEFSRDPIGKARLIFKKFEHPITALQTLHTRMADDLVRFGSETHEWATHVCNVTLLLLLSVEPLRIRTLRSLEIGHFSRGAHCWTANVPRALFKNPRGGARGGWVGDVPDVLTYWLDLYVNQARPILLNGAEIPFLFVNRNGQFDHKAISCRVIAQTKRYIADLAPAGLNPHVFRHIVASELFRSSETQGAMLAAAALKDKLSTVVRYAKEVDFMVSVVLPAASNAIWAHITRTPPPPKSIAA